MLSDAEIFHLQRSIAFHRSRQAEEISTRDTTILNLRSDNKNLNCIIQKHQVQYATVKEKLVKTVLDFEVRGVLVESEKTKNISLTVAADQKEIALEFMRQEKDFVRRQLVEAESLISSTSQQRSKIQELETSILHYREQIRLLTDTKISSDAQVNMSNKDFEEIKFKLQTANMKTDAIVKEKNSLIEENFELRQQMVKVKVCCADEIADMKREVTNVKDLAESERLLRFKLENIGESTRVKDMEECRRKFEIEQKEREREFDARSPLPALEKEKDKLISQLETIKVALECKEAERSVENDRTKDLEVVISKQLFEIEKNNRLVGEAVSRYDAIRAECKYARQKVLELVGFVVDIISISPVSGTVQEQKQRTGSTYKEKVLTESRKSNYVMTPNVQESLLMLSPRAKDSIRARYESNRAFQNRNSDHNQYQYPVTDMSPQQLFNFENYNSHHRHHYGSRERGGEADDIVGILGQNMDQNNNLMTPNKTECDPFDLAILYGLSDALCLPDLRGAIQGLRDHVEKITNHRISPETISEIEKNLEIEKKEKIKSEYDLEIEKNIVTRLKIEIEKSKITIKNLDISLATNKIEIQKEIDKRKLVEIERDKERLSGKIKDENRDIEMRKNRIVKIEKNRNNILLKDRLSVTLQNELRRSKSFSIMRGDGLQNPAPRMTQSLRSRDLNEVLRLQQQRDSDECDSYPSPTQSSEQRRGREEGREQGRERESSEWDGVQSQDDVRASQYSDQSIPSEEPFAFEIKIRDELKLTILTMARQHAAEREALCVQIETLKDKIGVLTTQNKNLSSSSSSTLPILFVPSLSPRRNDSLEGQKDKEMGAGAGMGTKSVGGEIVTDNVLNNRTYDDNNKDEDKDIKIELKNIKYSLSVELKKNDSLTALLDAAKSKILSLTSQLSHDRSLRSLDGKKDKNRERDRQRVRDSSTSPLPLSLPPPLPLPLSQPLSLPSPGDPNISNVTVEDIEELQAKLRWSGRHHTIMCRAVLLLER